MITEDFSCHYGSTGGRSAAGFFTDPLSLYVGEQIIGAYTPKKDNNQKPGSGAGNPESTSVSRYRSLIPRGSGS